MLIGKELEAEDHLGGKRSTLGNDSGNSLCSVLIRLDSAMLPTQQLPLYASLPWLHDIYPLLLLCLLCFILPLPNSRYSSNFYSLTENNRWKFSSTRTWALPCSQLYPQQPQRCLAHHRILINIYGMNEWPLNTTILSLIRIKVLELYLKLCLLCMNLTSGNSKYCVDNVLPF